jgi:hypothetical protein
MHPNTKMYRTYRVRRADRASRAVSIDAVVYSGNDSYGCASDDTRRFDIEYTAVSFSTSGEPFFTIPKVDLEEIKEESCETTTPTPNSNSSPKPPAENGSP